MSIWKLLGFGEESGPRGTALPETETVRKITGALDQLPLERARFIAAFAYVLSRVARADQTISPEEVRAMEQLVMQKGQLSEEQAIIVVQMAKTQSILFGGIEDFVVTREFNAIASSEEKRALLHCLYAVAAASGSISSMEDNEIRQIASELKIHHSEMIAIRLQFKEFLEILMDMKTEVPES
jgi:uncharacterized tellurite resistance protein B-like protein